LSLAINPETASALSIPSIEIAELGLTGSNSRKAIVYSPGLPLDRRNNTYQLVNNMTWTRGRHTTKWGVDIRRTGVASDTDNIVRGQLRYSTGDPASGGREQCLTHRLRWHQGHRTVPKAGR
jgi:hypothetical protein